MLREKVPVIIPCVHVECHKFLKYYGTQDIRILRIESIHVVREGEGIPLLIWSVLDHEIFLSKL